MFFVIIPVGGIEPVTPDSKELNTCTRSRFIELEQSTPGIK